MNEQNSKKILFNKSTLLSLKAELLKKQEEVSEKKRLPQHKVENFKPAPKPAEHRVDKPDRLSFKERLKEVDTEELDACRKAKLALEKKAELYEHLADGAGSSELASRFLVDFNTKKLKETPNHVPGSTPEPYESPPRENDDNEDSEWVEFTDCLGRTRKCHKSDLETYQQKDKELTRIVSNEKVPDEDPKRLYPDEDLPDVEVPKNAERAELAEKTNDYLKSLREKWEQKEQELLAKEKDIHYQDLLYDEARIHGVGYYSFSTDEKERRHQMDELMKQRQETLKAQQEASEQRKKRDELIAARVAAARARRRLRAGLPAEDPKENDKEAFTKCLLEYLTKQKNEADAKAQEEDRKRKEELEKERQKLREAYVRDWDIGKEGVGDKKKFREMTQEEYVEQQRGKRIDEFAPPKQTKSRKSDSMFDDRGRLLDTERPSSSKPKTWADVRPKENTPPPPDDDDLSSKGLYFSSKKELKYKNFVKSQEPTPIENELSDDGDDGKAEIRKPEKRKASPNHTEIAPPPTYDYYGPVPKHSRPKKPFDSDMREAFDQGAKSLESKDKRSQLSKDYDFTFD